MSQALNMNHNHVTAIAPTEFRFVSADGSSMACYRRNSSSPVRGVVQIDHGMGEHIGRYPGAIAMTNDQAPRGRMVRQASGRDAIRTRESKREQRGVAEDWQQFDEVTAAGS